MTHPKPTHPGGFTLVELMVALVIIAVLAALIFAISRKAMEKAAVATCTSNQRQIGIALASHDTDYRRYPGRSDGLAWDRALLPYLGYSGQEDLSGNAPLAPSEWGELEQIAQLFCCPADRKPRSGDVFKRSYAITAWTTNWSNGTSFRGWKNRPFNQGVPLAIVPNPARAAVVVEWHSGDNDGVPNRLGSGGHAFHDRGGPDGPDDTVHRRNQIVLFADGHTELLPFMPNSEFVEKYWPGQIGSTN